MRKETLNHISPKSYAAPEIKVHSVELGNAVMQGSYTLYDESGTEDDDVVDATSIISWM